jgi:hypothetical protein
MSPWRGPREIRSGAGGRTGGTNLFQFELERAQETGDGILHLCNGGQERRCGETRERDLEWQDSDPNRYEDQPMETEKGVSE